MDKIRNIAKRYCTSLIGIWVFSLLTISLMPCCDVMAGNHTHGNTAHTEHHAVPQHEEANHSEVSHIASSEHHHAQHGKSKTHEEGNSFCVDLPEIQSTYLINISNTYEVESKAALLSSKIAIEKPSFIFALKIFPSNIFQYPPGNSIYLETQRLRI